MEIATVLNITLNTVKTHLQRVYSKLGVKNRVELDHRLPGGGRVDTRDQD
jgi:DNA-binding CsgD family transcriptional regulator